MASNAAGVTSAGVPTRKEQIASIARQVSRLANGDRALLRRLRLVKSSYSRSSQADGVVIGLLRGADVPIPDHAHSFERWRLIAHVAALLSGTGGQPSHALGRPVGKVMKEADISEPRFLRLMAARGEPLHDQIVRVARVVAQAGKGPMDLWTLDNLTSRTDAVAERARLRIAKDYYDA